MPSDPRSCSRAEQRRKKARAIGRHIAGKRRAQEKYEARLGGFRAFGCIGAPPSPPQRINYGTKKQPANVRSEIREASVRTALESANSPYGLGASDFHQVQPPASYYESRYHAADAHRYHAGDASHIAREHAPFPSAQPATNGSTCTLPHQHLLQHTCTASLPAQQYYSSTPNTVQQNRNPASAYHPYYYHQSGCFTHR